MAKRYQRGKHFFRFNTSVYPFGIQWPKDTKGVNRSLKSTEKQYNGQKIPKG